MDEHKSATSDKKQDVIVVGAGIAGLVAAIEAAAYGAKVVVLDKLGPAGAANAEGIPAGGIGNETSLASGGGLIRSSLDAPAEELLNRHVERGWGRIDATLISVYLKRLLEDIKWLKDDLGLPYAGNRVKGRGAGVNSYLCGVAMKRGVHVSLGTKALRLLTDGVGRVTGVRAKSGNRVEDLEARAVVLATGSFEGNQEMLIKYLGPDITYAMDICGCVTNTGDGHMMASEVGAQLINISVSHARTTDKNTGQDPSRLLEKLYPLGIYVNTECRRFVDEGTADSDTIGNAIAYQTGGEAALIFDEKARDKYPEEFEKYPEKEKAIKTAGTIGELATKIKMSPEELGRLMVEFNAAVEDGKALSLELPKTDQAYRIDTPPFYALYPVAPGLAHPLGGLKINARAQVLDMENSPIPGLYAAGSLINWSFGKPYVVSGITSYMGSYHAGASGGLPVALVFGRIAGKGAAEER